MSIREIIRRFAQGLPLEGGKEALYDYQENEPDDPDRLVKNPLTMDLSEMEDEIEITNTKLKEARETATAKQAEQKRAERLKKEEAAKEEAAYQKELAKRRRLANDLKSNNTP